MPITTPDGRYIVVRNRLWRASNPDIPPAELDRLRRELMSARRAVQSALGADDAEAERKARRRVHRAKVALGERGKPWWTDGADDFNRHMVHNTPYAEWWAGIERIGETLTHMLGERAEGATVCPSEIARAVAPVGWRARMEDVRSVARELAIAGDVVIMQRGRRIDPKKEWKGPIRIGRPPTS